MVPESVMTQVCHKRERQKHTHTAIYTHTHSYPQPVMKIEATDLGTKAKRDDAFMGQTETLIVPPPKKSRQ